MLEKKPTPRPPDYTLLSKAWNLGFLIVFLTLLGHWLDQKLHTSALLTLSGAALGVLYCFYEAWRVLKGK